MIDPDLIESYASHTQQDIRNALAVLAQTGVLLAQRDRLAERLLNGSDSEEVGQLAGSIIQYRKTSQALLQLHQFGEQFLAEVDQ
jgi:ribosomal protein L6P/L9E